MRQGVRNTHTHKIAATNISVTRWDISENFLGSSFLPWPQLLNWIYFIVLIRGWNRNNSNLRFALSKVLKNECKFVKYISKYFLQGTFFNAFFFPQTHLIVLKILNREPGIWIKWRMLMQIDISFEKTRSNFLNIKRTCMHLRFW